MIELEDGIVERGIRSSNYYTKPEIELSSESYQLMKEIPTGIKQVAFLSKTTNDESEELGISEPALEDLQAFLTPPNEKYSDVVTPQAREVAAQVDNIATQQVIKQFYEVYISPIGFKDIYNRLGEIAGNIEDVHLLYPNGLKGLLGADPNASWRTNLNFAFQVDEGITNTKGEHLYTKYSSLAFPPFISHETYDWTPIQEKIKEQEEKEEEEIEKEILSTEGEEALANYRAEKERKKNALDVSFDMKNLLYKKNRATYRFPAFKAVNDNIHTLQVLLNRCFGTESTFMNEWDLSMYMQEGLCSMVTKNTISVDGKETEINYPEMVTTLTYGLLSDAPLKGNLDGSGLKDLKEAEAFASVNMAVSTRKAIDDQSLGTVGANERLYEINKYGFSSYWAPWEDGELNIINYGKNNTKIFNTSDYIRTMFSYDENADTYNKANPYGRNYTPAIFHGADLAFSTKDFQRVLNYSDNRYAILSGWNSTDISGKPYMQGTPNGNVNSNAYSFLPFWKQLYTNEEDGMSDIDLYMQEIIASKKDTSFLDASYNIISYLTENNQPFQDLLDATKDEQLEFLSKVGDGLGTGEDMDAIDTSQIPANSDREPSDYSFKLFKCKLKIPGSKLLKMFLNRKSKEAKANQQMKDYEADTTSSKVLDDLPQAKVSEPKTVIDEEGNETEITEFTPSFDDGLCNKKIVGDGVAEYSPFIYGGPHGRFLSPFTLEGYTQPGNANLSEVPTLDCYSLTIPVRYNNNTPVTDISKNFKNRGSYIDGITCMSSSERNILLKGSGKFGVTNIVPDNHRWEPYWTVAQAMTYTDTPKYLTYSHRVEKSNYSSSRYDSDRYEDCYHSIPDPFYQKRFRNQNWGGWWRHEHTAELGTTGYSTQITQNFWVDRKDDALDFVNQEFVLLPVDSWDNYWRIPEGSIRSYISGDMSRFRELKDNPTSKAPGSRIWWIVVPTSSGSNIVYSQNVNLATTPSASYYSSSGSWENQVKNLYEKGNRQVQVTIPITDASGNILNIVSGVAHLVKKTVTSYVRIFHCHFNWHYSPYGSHRRHCRHWGCGNWWVSHYHCDYKQKIETPSYYVCIDPGRIVYNIPTHNILNKELNINSSTRLRNKDSANLIERWRLVSDFSHIDDGSPKSPAVFPFSLEFNSKYGWRNGVTLPTIPDPNNNTPSMYTASSLKSLRASGVFFRDLAKDFRTTGKVLATTSLKTAYDRFYSTYQRNDLISSDEGEWRRIHEHLRYFGSSDCYVRSGWGQCVMEHLVNTGVYNQYLPFTAANPTLVVASYSEVPVIKNLLNNLQTAPSVIQAFSRNGVSKMYAYTTIDVFSVYIETASMQLQWLKQLKDYVDLYVKDYIIYETYQKSVDLQTQKIIHNEKENGDYRTLTDNFGYTPSYTEDINYHDALAIVVRLFNTEDHNKNTLSELIAKRITIIEKLKKEAITLRGIFNSNPASSIERFIRLVTNTRSILNNARNGSDKAENVLFDSKGNYRDVLFPLSTSTTYDLINNPATGLWAYINVLYHVRRFWINKRFNKKNGSYWTLRGLERVMMFLIANKENEDANSAEDVIATGKTTDNNKMDIIFSQPRTSFQDQVKKGINSVDTKAVYIKVRYLGTGEPKKSKKWNEETQRYSGNEIVWVKEAFKWAFKPKNGMYLLMSSEISKNINQGLALLRTTNRNIYADTYDLTKEDALSIKQILSSGEDNNTLKVINFIVEKIEEISRDNPKKTTFGEIPYLKNKYTKDLIALELSKNDIEKAFNSIKKILFSYKNESQLEKIKSNLFPVYVRWDPSSVWTGMNSSEGDSHIDQYQYENTGGVERKVKDFYGFEHSTGSDAIKAGITFDAVMGLDVGTILSSPTALKTMTPLETLCASQTTMDLWRVELPEKLKVNIKLLETKPVLMPADLVLETFDSIKDGKITASEKTVLAGVQTNQILPILEAGEDLFTINSLASLGEFREIGEAAPLI